MLYRNRLQLRRRASTYIRCGHRGGSHTSESGHAVRLAV